MIKRIFVLSLLLFPILAYPSQFFNTNNKKLNISSEKISYYQDKSLIEATGNVKVIYKGFTLICDHIIYDLKLDKVKAYGNVKLVDENGIEVFGEYVIIKNDFKEAIISELKILFKDSIIKADKVKNYSKDKTVFTKALYSSCPECKKGKRIWQIRANKITIDHKAHRVKYENAFFEVYGVAVGYAPFFSHSTPKAPASSGFLSPHIGSGNIRLPIYYRRASNLDLTFTPRIYKDKIISENQIRYLTPSGKYNFYGSLLPKPTVHYYSKASGEHNSGGSSYSFNLEGASDKFYVKNYRYTDKPFLTSQISRTTILENGYYNIETMSFQDMRDKEYLKPSPYILPSIFIKKNYNFETTKLSTEAKTVTTRNADGKKNIFLSSKALWSKPIISNNGHVFNVDFYIRSDIYSSHKENSDKVYNKLFIIPEQHLGWRYPLMNINENGAINIIEPQVKLVSTFSKGVNKLLNNDSSAVELKEANLFKNNRYSGIDRYENGNRISTGVRWLSSSKDEAIIFNSFLGRLFKFDDKQHYPSKSYIHKKNSCILGKISLFLYKTVDFYYNFVKNPNKPEPIQGDLGISYNNGKDFSSNIGIIESKLFLLDEPKKIKQIYLGTNYTLNNNWQIWGNIRKNLRFGKGAFKESFTHYGTGFSYNGDCMIITFSVNNNINTDRDRGIFDHDSTSFTINLKTLNF